MASLYAKNDTLYAHARDDSVIAIDLESGTIIWRFTKVEE